MRMNTEVRSALPSAKTKPPSGATTGGTPEHPQKVANIFRNISGSTLSFSYPWKKLARGVSNYGRGRPSRGAAYASGIRHPPHHLTSKSLMNAKFLAEVYQSRIREHGSRVKKNEGSNAQGLDGPHCRFNNNEFLNS